MEQASGMLNRWMGDLQGHRYELQVTQDAVLRIYLVEDLWYGFGVFGGRELFKLLPLGDDLAQAKQLAVARFTEELGRIQETVFCAVRALGPDGMSGEAEQRAEDRGDKRAYKRGVRVKVTCALGADPPGLVGHVGWVESEPHLDGTVPVLFTNGSSRRFFVDQLRIL